MISAHLNKLYALIKGLSGDYVGKAFSVFSLAQAINGITSFGLVAMYTKRLPPEDYGRLSLIWLLITVLSIIIDGRLNTAFCIKYYKISKEDNTRNLYTILAFNLLMAITLFLLFYRFSAVTTGLIKIELTVNELLLVIFITVAMVIYNLFTSVLVVSQRPREYFYAIVIFNASLIFASLVFLLALDQGYYAYLKSYLFAYLLMAIISLAYFFVRFPPHRQLLISAANLKQLIKIGLPLIPDGLMLMFLTWAGRYILNLYSGLAVVGVYSVAYNFSSIFNNFIVSPFGQAVMPLMFKKYATSRDEYKQIMASIFKYYWIVMSILILGYLVILKELFELFVGQKYLSGYNIVAIVLIGIVLSGANNLLSSTVIMKEKTSKIMVITTISVALNITLNLVLVPYFGMYGASIAILLSYLLQLCIMYYYTQRLIPIDYDTEFIIKSITISAVFIALIIVTSYFNVNPVIKVALKAALLAMYITLYVKNTDLFKTIKQAYSPKSVAE